MIAYDTSPTTVPARRYPTRRPAAARPRGGRAVARSASWPGVAVGGGGGGSVSRWRAPAAARCRGASTTASDSGEDRRRWRGRDSCAVGSGRERVRDARPMAPARRGVRSARRGRDDGRRLGTGGAVDRRHLLAVERSVLGRAHRGVVVAACRSLAALGPSARRRSTSANLIVRKCAHFVEYAILSMLAYRALGASTGRARAAPRLLAAVALAVVLCDARRAAPDADADPHAARRRTSLLDSARRLRRRALRRRRRVSSVAARGAPPSRA